MQALNEFTTSTLLQVWKFVLCLLEKGKGSELSGESQYRNTLYCESNEGHPEIQGAFFINWDAIAGKTRIPHSFQTVFPRLAGNFQRFDIALMEATSRCKPLVFSGLETALWGCSCYHGIFFEKNGKKGLTRGIDF